YRPKYISIIIKLLMNRLGSFSMWDVYHVIDEEIALNGCECAAKRLAEIWRPDQVYLANWFLRCVRLVRISPQSHGPSANRENAATTVNPIASFPSQQFNQFEEGTHLCERDLASVALRSCARDD